MVLQPQWHVLVWGYPQKFTWDIEIQLDNNKMFLENYQHSKNKEMHIITLLILFSILIRIPVLFLFGDKGLENEWLVLLNNLVNHGTLAFTYHDENLSKFLFPNLYMPPLYAYYLYFFSFFELESESYTLIILLSHVVLSSISVAIFCDNR